MLSTERVRMSLTVTHGSDITPQSQMFSVSFMLSLCRVCNNNGVLFKIPIKVKRAYAKINSTNSSNINATVKTVLGGNFRLSENIHFARKTCTEYCAKLHLLIGEIFLAAMFKIQVQAQQHVQLLIHKYPSIYQVVH